jgi:HlyD family secretion protein
MIEERNQLNRRWLWLGALLLIIAVFILVRSLTKDRVQVHAATAARVPLINEVSTNGRVEPEENYAIYSPISTTVKAVYIQPGDVVAAGKLLMVLDDVQARAHLATAESGVKAAQAALEAATHNGSQLEHDTAVADETRARLDRDEARRDMVALTKLNAAGAASSSEVTAARQRMEAADVTLRAMEQSTTSRYSPAEVERARAALTDAEAGLTAAREVMAQTVLRAPVAGTVYDVEVGRTEYVEEGKLLIQVADLHHERIRAYFDEPEIGSLQVGQKIQIKWDAKQGRVWNGHIERTPVTVINRGTRSVGEVLVKIDDSDSGLLPETNVNVTVTISSEPNALSIPRDALHDENGKTFVYKVENNRLQRTPVTIGSINLTQVAILSGIGEGDLVATRSINGDSLRDGVAVVVR